MQSTRTRSNGAEVWSLSCTSTDRTGVFKCFGQGFAWCYTRYLPRASANIQASYRQAEAEAREQRRGLWSEPGPVEPWLFRRGARQIKAKGNTSRSRIAPVILTLQPRQECVYQGGRSCPLRIPVSRSGVQTQLAKHTPASCARGQPGAQLV